MASVYYFQTKPPLPIVFVYDLLYLYPPKITVIPIMRMIRRFSFIIFLTITTLSMNAQQTDNNAFFNHTVEKGQSLYAIAGMYHVSIDDIVQMNPGSDKQINTGSILKIPQKKQAGEQSSTTFHTIQPGETLYKLTQLYGVSAQAICDSNPGLSASNFKAGQVIAIPQQSTPQSTEKISTKQEETATSNRKTWKEMHRVEKGETFATIAIRYGVSEKDLQALNPEVNSKKPRKGSFIFIPYSRNELENYRMNAPQNSNENLFKVSKNETRKLKTVKAAIILPFHASESTASSERTRMVEFYQGFLIALDSLKRMGLSVELRTYDTQAPDQSIERLIQKPELKQQDIIFGPMAANDVQSLARFAKANKIRLVVPFAPRINEVFDNPYIYQVNTPQSYLYSEVYDHFISRFKKSRVIFLQTDYNDRDKIEFVDGLRQELRKNRIPTDDLTVGPDLMTESILAQMDTLNHTVFVPLTGESRSLARIIPQLVELNRTHPKIPFSLFGYPEWQTYTRDYVSKYYPLDTYFYSSFYTNNLFKPAIQFAGDFRKWYGKDMANTYPKYGMLGFDIGFYFLKGLYREGSNFDNRQAQIKVTPIQTGFKFDRVNTWGGFINRKVFFIHFNRKFEILKYDFE